MGATVFEIAGGRGRLGSVWAPKGLVKEGLRFRPDLAFLSYDLKSEASNYPINQILA